jgi:uncharacterized protein YndB with AHSA1/START domain/DNA-binding transcriptional ArsR family regulator
MDAVFKALADATRRRLLDELNVRNGLSLRELSAGAGMSRQAVAKHLAVLEEARLVTTVWHGREKLHYLNAAPINDIAERWINRYDRARVHALADLKTALEDAPMPKPDFVYVTYIRTTPERLWQALTDPAFTKRYWGVEFTTDWTEGAPMTWRQGGVDTSDPEQVVLVSDPYRRLSYTWHTFTPDWAARAGKSAEAVTALAAEPRSTVTFDIDKTDAAVKLTVTHDGFAPDSTLLHDLSNGWPHVIASLKSLLESGEPL